MTNSILDKLIYIGEDVEEFEYDIDCFTEFQLKEFLRVLKLFEIKISNTKQFKNKIYAPKADEIKETLINKIIILLNNKDFNIEEMCDLISTYIRVPYKYKNDLKFIEVEMEKHFSNLYKQEYKLFNELDDMEKLFLITKFFVNFYKLKTYNDLFCFRLNN